MKAKVLREFKDKYSGEIYKKGATITVTKARFEEILTVGELVEEIKTAKKPKESAE